MFVGFVFAALFSCALSLTHKKPGASSLPTVGMPLNSDCSITPEVAKLAELFVTDEIPHLSEAQQVKILHLAAPNRVQFRDDDIFFSAEADLWWSVLAPDGEDFMKKSVQERKGLIERAWAFACVMNAEPRKGSNKAEVQNLGSLKVDFEAQWMRFNPEESEFMGLQRFGALMFDLVPEMTWKQIDFLWLILCQANGADPKKGLNKEQFLDFFQNTDKPEAGGAGELSSTMPQQATAEELANLDELWNMLVPKGQGFMTKTQVQELFELEPQQGKLLLTEVSDLVWHLWCKVWKVNPQQGITKKHLLMLYRNPENSLNELEEDLKLLKKKREGRDMSSDLITV